MSLQENSPIEKAAGHQHALAGGRRTRDPITTVYRPVIIEVSDFTGFCLVRNISSRGLQGVVYADLASHQHIGIKFGPNCRIDGTVVWSRDQRIGVQFDKEIDVVDVLHNLGKKLSNNLAIRALRLPIQFEVRLALQSESFSATAHDISQRGTNLSSAKLSPGDEVFVHLDGIEPRLAITRWVNNGLCGLNFVRPINLDTLAEWIVDRQSAQLPVGGPPSLQPL